MQNKMEKMMQMMDQKSPSEPSEKDVQAKKDVLMELLAECDSELQGRAGRGLDSAKQMKVSVIAKDPKDLKAGLEKAEAMMPEEDQAEEEAEMPEEEKAEDQSESAPGDMQDALEDAAKKAASDDEDEDQGFFQKKRKKDRDF